MLDATGVALALDQAYKEQDLQEQLLGLDTQYLKETSDGGAEGWIEKLEAFERLGRLKRES